MTAANPPLPMRPTPHERDGRQPTPQPARPHPGGDPVTDEQRKELSAKVAKANQRSEQGRGGGQR